ncbi:Putative Yip1 domain protein [Giardia duodenalis]|uniref:Protein YIPF n=1 Tax=Giardia intestinalis TaxID=5741 RepID=V6TN39_GIAIN|nr:Putative Yip1 domain protein [Giardia intestinalis]
MAFYAEEPGANAFNGTAGPTAPSGASHENGPPTEEELRTVAPPEWMLSTLDESVGTTFKREFTSMGKKTLQILWIFKSSTADHAVYETYDFIGPTFWLTLYSLFLVIIATKNGDNTGSYFGIAFAIYFCVGYLVAFNTNIVGGRVHIPGTFCFLGYCLMPLAAYTFVAMIMALLAGNLANSIRSLIVGLTAILATTWSSLAAYAFFKNLALQGKAFMTIYPVILFFVVFGVLGLIGAKQYIQPQP